MENADLQRVANYGDANEAEHICSILQDNGLAAFVDGAAASSWMPHVGSALGGVSVFVRAEDFAEAREIIDSLDLGDKKFLAPWFCGTCLEQIEGGFDVCWSCGKTAAEVGAPFPDTASVISEANPPTEELAELSEHQQSNPYATPRSNPDAKTETPTNEVEINEEAEDNLKRAFRAAVIGMVFIPVITQCYSMYLLFKALSFSSSFSSKGNLRFFGTIVINVCVIATWGYMLSVFGIGH